MPYLQTIFHHGSILSILLIMLGGLSQLEAQIATNSSPKAEEVEIIENLLKRQDKAWNEGDLEAFMSTYWKSKKLTFSGGGKTTRGWKATLEKYKKSYPKGKMGTLSFADLETVILNQDTALVLGKWQLQFAATETQPPQSKKGNFSLVMKKFKQGWKIIHDHSSTLEEEKGWISIAQTTTLCSKIMGAPEKSIKLQNRGKWSMVEADYTTGKSGFERDPVFFNRETGHYQKQRPEIFR